jgi:hypothetical protein
MMLKEPASRDAGKARQEAEKALEEKRAKEKINGESDNSIDDSTQTNFALMKMVKGKLLSWLPSLLYHLLSSSFLS